MNRNIVIGLVVLAAAVGLVLYFTRRADAATRSRTRPSGQPPPLREATVQTSQGTVTLEQGAQVRPEFADVLARPIGQPVGVPQGVQLQQMATLKPGVRELWK